MSGGPPARTRAESTTERRALFVRPSHPSERSYTSPTTRSEIGSHPTAREWRRDSTSRRIPP